MNTETILASALSLIVGGVVAYIVAMGKVKNLQAESEKEAGEIIKKAKIKILATKISLIFNPNFIILKVLSLGILAHYTFIFVHTFSNQ